MTKEALEKAGFPYDFVATSPLQFTLWCGATFTVTGWGTLHIATGNRLIRGSMLRCHPPTPHAPIDFLWLGREDENPPMRQEVWQLIVTVNVPAATPDGTAFPTEMRALLPLAFLPHYPDLQAASQALHQLVVMPPS